jgi:hypothetical protein
MDPSGPDPLSARMDALTEANLRLLRRVGDLEQRVARLEGARTPAEEPAYVPPPPCVRTRPPEPATSSQAEPEAEAPPPSRHRFTRAEHGRDRGFGRNGRRADLGQPRRGADADHGAAFFFKYAVDNAWIGPRAGPVGVLAGGAGGLE